MLARHCSYFWFECNPTTSVNTFAMLLFPRTWNHPYDTVHVGKSICIVFVLIVYAILQYGIYPQQGEAKIICDHILHLFGLVLIVATIYGVLEWHTLWPLPVLLLLYNNNNNNTLLKVQYPRSSVDCTN